MRLRAALVALVASFALAACHHAPAAPRESTLFFRGEPVARVDDVVDGMHVERTEKLAATGETVVTTATLDVAGLAVRARYVRDGRRTVTLEPERGGAVLADGSGARRVLERPAVLIDLLRYVEPPRPLDVALVDLSSGDAVDGKVERRGAEVVALDVHGAVVARANVEGVRTGPGAFAEGDAPPALDTAPISPAWAGPVPPHALRLLGVDDVLPAMDLAGPGQRAQGPVITFDAGEKPARPPSDADRSAGLFLESADPAVAAFARKHAASAGGDASALADATSIAEAVHALVDAGKNDEPPSATGMLAHGGDCDGAAALVTASLRALGHAARPVSGYRLVDNRLSPHAWAEVYVPGEGWLVVDATQPFVGVDATHLKLFSGLGSSLTMGRVLGKLRVEPVL